MHNLSLHYESKKTIKKEYRFTKFTLINVEYIKLFLN